jgi:hypothetical protein
VQAPQYANQEIAYKPPAIIMLAETRVHAAVVMGAPIRALRLSNFLFAGEEHGRIF